LKIVAKYDFNGGKEAVEEKYGVEFKQIEAVINSIDSTLYKTKESTEKSDTAGTGVIPTNQEKPASEK